MSGASRATRFQKGRSGNPRGRPRKKPGLGPSPSNESFDAIMRRELEEEMSMSINGRPKASYAVVFIKTVRRDALRGCKNSRRLMMSYIMHCDQTRPERKEPGSAEEILARNPYLAQVYAYELLLLRSLRELDVLRRQHAWDAALVVDGEIYAAAVARGLVTPERAAEIQAAVDKHAVGLIRGI